MVFHHVRHGSKTHELPRFFGNPGAGLGLLPNLPDLRSASQSRLGKGGGLFPNLPDLVLRQKIPFREGGGYSQTSRISYPPGNLV